MVIPRLAAPSLLNTNSSMGNSSVPAGSGDGPRRRLRWGVWDAELGEPLLPSQQASEVGHRQGDVVQAGMTLIEGPVA